jgi:hypothetical protein
MPRYVILIVAIVVVAYLSGCRTAQPSAPATPKQTTTANKLTPEPATATPLTTIVARPTFAVTADNKPLAWNGGKYTAEPTTAIEITYPAGCYTSLFQRQEGKLTELAKYQGIPQAKDKRIWVSLKPFNQDSDWFLVTGSQPISPGDASIASAVASAPEITPAEAASPVMIKPLLWRLYSIATQGGKPSTPQLGMQIEISQAPFALEMFLQKPGETSFNTFVPAGSELPEGGQLQLKVTAKRATYLGVFLCYIGKERPEKIVQIFPGDEQEKTLVICDNTSVAMPQQGAIAMEKSDAKRVIYCFPSDQPLACQGLNKWLSEKARGYAAVESLEHEEVISMHGEEGVDRVEAEYRHMRVDLQPKKK